MQQYRFKQLNKYHSQTTAFMCQVLWAFSHEFLQ